MKLIIKNCSECPLFGKSLVSVIASRGNPHAGDCRAPGITKHGEVTKAKSLPVTDCRELPHWCPLRMGDISISIGNRGTA